MTTYDVDEWLERIRDGLTYQAIADRHGISRERVRQLVAERPEFDEARRAGRIARTKGSLERRVARDVEYGPRVVELRRQGTSFEEIGKRLGIGQTFVSRLAMKHLGFNERRTSRSNGRRLGFTDEEILDALRAADAVNVNPTLRIDDYRAYARRHGTASGATIVFRFGRWANACAAADVPHETNGRHYTNYIGEETCWDAVRRCDAELALGHVPTYQQYEDWRAENPGAPCGAIIRRRLGGWMSVIATLSG